MGILIVFDIAWQKSRLKRVFLQTKKGIMTRASLQFDFLDKSSKTIDILPIFFEPKWSPHYNPISY